MAALLSARLSANICITYATRIDDGMRGNYHDRMKSILNPSFLGDLKTPWSAGLTIHWYVALFFFSMYIPLLLLYLALGLNPAAMTVTFFVGGLEAVSPLLTETIGCWLLISYLFNSVMPIPISTGDGGHILAYVTFGTLCTILSAVAHTLACSAAAIFSSDVLPRPWLSSSLSQHSLASLRPPRLSESWTPGSSPHLLYE